MIPETNPAGRKSTQESRLALCLLLAATAASISVACVERITIYESDSVSDEPDGGSLALGDAGSPPKPASNDDAGSRLSDAASPEPGPKPGPEPTVTPHPDGGSESMPTGCFECPCDENQSCEGGLVCASSDTCVGAVWASPDPVSDQALIWDEGVWQ